LKKMSPGGIAATSGIKTSERITSLIQKAVA